MHPQPVEKNGAPGKIRTPNLLIRSQVLYPVELRAREVADIPSGGWHGNGYPGYSAASALGSPAMPRRRCSASGPLGAMVKRLSTEV